MKYTTTLGAIVLAMSGAMLGTNALAQYTGPGALPPSTSVQGILDRPVDDQRVTLTGKIVRQLRGDKYLFSDGQAEIRVEIDGHLFGATPVTADTRVQISGEVEKDFVESPEIDVDTLHILN